MRVQPYASGEPRSGSARKPDKGALPKAPGTVLAPNRTLLLWRGLDDAQGDLPENVLRKRRQDVDTAEEVAQVGVGLKAVELATREQRDEVGRGVAALLGADEEPIVTPPGDAAQFAFGPIVVQRIGDGICNSARNAFATR